MTITNKDLNLKSIREITLVKAQCANTVRHLMKDERSRNAIDAAIAFGNGKMEKKELKWIAHDAKKVTNDSATHSTVPGYTYAAYVAHATATLDVVDSSWAVGSPKHIAASAVAAAENAAYVEAYAADGGVDTALFAADIAKAKIKAQTDYILEKYLPSEIWNKI